MRQQKKWGSGCIRIFAALVLVFGAILPRGVGFPFFSSNLFDGVLSGNFANPEHVAHFER